jgi:hypothetical protein
MVKLVLTAAVRLLEVAVSLYVPARLILQPAKMATPADALLGFWVQVRTAPLAGGVITSVTEAAVVVTVLPPASRTVTRGWMANAMSTVESDGEAVNASWVAGPTVMVKLALEALVSPVEIAVKV